MVMCGCVTPHNQPPIECRSTIHHTPIWEDDDIHRSSSSFFVAIAIGTPTKGDVCHVRRNPNSLPSAEQPAHRGNGGNLSVFLRREHFEDLGTDTPTAESVCKKFLIVVFLKLKFEISVGIRRGRSKSWRELPARRKSWRELGQHQLHRVPTTHAWPFRWRGSTERNK